MNGTDSLRPGDASTARTERAVEVRVWDLFVRVFHWSVVALFAFAWYTGNRWDTPHEWAGYAIGALVLARVAWGFVGSAHARFSDFVRRPSAVFGFLHASVRLRAPRHLGHNPAGGAMVLALLAGLGAIATTGWLQTTDRFWGVGWVQEAHVVSVDIVLGLIALHLVGVLVASLEHHENLVRAMLDGRKRKEPVQPG